MGHFPAVPGRGFGDHVHVGGKLDRGFDAPLDESTQAKFAEMRYLEKSIGRTGLLALQPLLHISNEDLWQLHMLGR